MIRASIEAVQVENRAAHTELNRKMENLGERIDRLYELLPAQADRVIAPRDLGETRVAEVRNGGGHGPSAVFPLCVGSGSLVSERDLGGVVRTA